MPLEMRLAQSFQLLVHADRDFCDFQNWTTFSPDQIVLMKPDQRFRKKEWATLDSICF